MKHVTIKYLSGLGILASICFPAALTGQSSQKATSKDSVRIAANKEYDKASKFKRLMFGEHYRQEWATTVDISILDMDGYAGGLTAVKAGGGLQTRSLRLEGKDGHEYVLRSVNKDPSKALVEELRGTFADDVVQDQISSSNPYAPLVVASLAKAAGIYHSTPSLVYVPKSPRLGTFANEFAETLCLLEERPAGSEEDNPSYGNSKNVVNSEKLFEKIFSNSDHQVDEKAFLKARLFDMWIGDWDRHEDQWVWAAFKENGKTIYRPVPRDRDQAFSKLDGVVPWMMSRKWALRKVQNFDHDIRDINGLNMNGGHLDRSFTTRLSISDWLTVANELRTEMTDEVIANAFAEMPEEIFAISGKGIVEKLKSRRSKLSQYAEKYYRFLTKTVTIAGTSDEEIFEVTRINDELTSVAVYKTGDKAGITYQRTFTRWDTKEIRLYGLGGKDVFRIDGKASKGIVVRVMGGKGDDSITDHSSVKGGSHLTKIYDDNANVTASPETRTYVSTDTLKNNYYRRGFRYDWFMPVARPGYNPDDGIYVGGSLIFKKQQFGKAPYGYMQMIGANYAFKTSAYNFWYKGIFKEFIRKWDLNIDAQVNAPNYSRNYFGLGNETGKLDDAEKSYYRVRFNQILTSASLSRQFGTKHSIDAGIGYQSVKVENNEGRFVSDSYSKLDSADFGRKHYADVHFTYQFSTVDNVMRPKRGIRFNAGAEYNQNLRESDKNYTQVFSDISTYTSFGPLTLASRIGVASNLDNDYEFFQANTLGNSANLRGYRKDRFAGKTSVYQNTELRYTAGYMNAYFVKGTWGLLGFYDNGRVWQPEVDSKKWHHGYGGGLWFMPFNKMAVTATYGISKEDKLITIGTGFLF